MTFVSDTSPITNLAAIAQLDLLHQLYSTILILEAVYEELTRFNVPGSVEVQTLSWIETVAVVNTELVVQLELELDNANTAELLQIIASMRQTAAQFPPDVRDEIIIDIEDIETEIQKPESDRNQTLLKKRLAAILAAATATGVAIAGMTDFANNAIDLSNKLGIEVSLPSAK